MEPFKGHVWSMFGNFWSRKTLEQGGALKLRKTVSTGPKGYVNEESYYSGCERAIFGQCWDSVWPRSTLGHIELWNLED